MTEKGGVSDESVKLTIPDDGEKKALAQSYDNPTYSGGGHSQKFTEPLAPPSIGSEATTWTVTKCLIIAFCTLCVGIGVGVGIGIATSSGGSDPPATTNNPPATTTTRTTPTTTTASPDTTTTTAGPTTTRGGIGGTECFSGMQFPTKPGTGEIPNTNGTVWRNKDCPVPGRAQCPQGINSPVILLSLDGFRADYLLRKMTPNLERMTECGAHAPFMQAVFPTKTFPNHYTLATGLYPESHGIIDNNMFDTEMLKSFSLSSDETFNPDWWEGEPIWNTVTKAGKKAATLFWPGSDVPIQGLLPDVCYLYDGSVDYTDRVREVLSFFDGAVADIPDFITLYYDEPDTTGHRNGDGPFNPKMEQC